MLLQEPLLLSRGGRARQFCAQHSRCWGGITPTRRLIHGARTTLSLWTHKNSLEFFGGVSNCQRCCHVRRSASCLLWRGAASAGHAAASSDGCPIGLILPSSNALVASPVVVLFTKSCQIKQRVATTGYRYGLSNHIECLASEFVTLRSRWRLFCVYRKIDDPFMTTHAVLTASRKAAAGSSVP